MIQNGGHEKRTKGVLSEEKLQRLQVGYCLAITSEDNKALFIQETARKIVFSLYFQNRNR